MTTTASSAVSLRAVQGRGYDNQTAIVCAHVDCNGGQHGSRVVGVEVRPLAQQAADQHRAQHGEQS
jgi:hypothetical protein